jgi:hypothetical protein
MVRSFSKLLHDLRFKRSGTNPMSESVDDMVSTGIKMETTIVDLTQELHLKIAQYLDSSPVITSSGRHRPSSLTSLGQVNQVCIVSIVKGEC